MSDVPVPNASEVAEALGFFFPRLFKAGAPLSNPDAALILSTISQIERHPIHYTRFNQMLHFLHEPGVSTGFFDYYFLKQSPTHPYPLDKVYGYLGAAETNAITSINQVCLGLRRFFIDALLFFGDIRNAYRRLRTLSFEALCRFFEAKRIATDPLKKRGDALPIRTISIDDRHLISEIAYKACSKTDDGAQLPLIKSLSEAYSNCGGGPLTLGQLRSSANLEFDPQGLLEFMVEDEYADTKVSSLEDIPLQIAPLLHRYHSARQAALDNSRRYLSLVNELDVYVATSMRLRADFRGMARDCEFIFSQPGIKQFNVRYFDPTMSAAEGHEDKGLIECLIVKCCKALLYFAGDRDSFGKDVEVAMALSLGKPSVILCSDDDKGLQRMKFFRDVHPLSRLIEFDAGIAMGAMVTQSRDVAAKMLQRLLSNHMEYDLSHDGSGYFRLKERLTGSVVRLQTSDRLLRESFWNYYHSSDKQFAKQP